MGIPKDYVPKAPPKKEYDLLPEDTYEVVISNLELREDQPVYQSDEVEDKYSFEFTVVEEGEFKNRKLWMDVRPIMSAGFEGGNASWLYKIFCAVNAVKLSDDEAKLVDVNSVNELEGKQLRLVVKQKQNTKKVMKNKIENVLPSKTAKPVLTPQVDDIIQIDKDDIPF